MRIIVTCGPSFEPIDAVRRITNFSTGELGVLLANRLAGDGHDVTCCKGSGATTSLSLETETVAFTTNDHLLELLKNSERRQEIGAVFHAAALSDFKVEQALNEKGFELRVGKISSNEPAILLRLTPAAKILPRLRELFPRSLVVGWKYETDGERQDAIQRAREQMQAHGTAGSVANGPAYGAGFGFCSPDGAVEHAADRPALCSRLAEWVNRA